MIYTTKFNVYVSGTAELSVEAETGEEAEEYVHQLLVCDDEEKADIGQISADSLEKLGALENCEVIYGATREE